jgi:hypothetical protein
VAGRELATGDDHEHESDEEFGRAAEHALDRLLRRTGAGRRECVLRRRCGNENERRDWVRMQCNTVASQDDQSVVLRLTAQHLGTRCDVERFRRPLYNVPQCRDRVRSREDCMGFEPIQQR